MRTISRETPSTMSSRWSARQSSASRPQRLGLASHPRKGAGLILSTPRMLESVNSGAQRGAGGHVGLIGATLPT